MAGGARVVPIDYHLSEEELFKELSQVNGLYIPGDARDTLDDETHLS